MPIADTDIIPRLSGGPSNEDVDASIGGAMSTVENGKITSDEKNNLIGDISSSEAAAGITLYRGTYYENEHVTLDYQNPVVWIEQQTTSGDTSVEIAIADEAKNTAIETLADEETAPDGPTFTTPASKGAGLPLGTLNPSDYRGMWEKYIVNSSASAFADQFQIDIEGDSGP